jgi:hypothetical protein
LSGLRSGPGSIFFARSAVYAAVHKVDKATRPPRAFASLTLGASDGAHGKKCGLLKEPYYQNSAIARRTAGSIPIVTTAIRNHTSGMLEV